MALQQHGYKVAQSYVFESLRVGNKAFAAAFKTSFSHAIPLFRNTYKKDPVVHCPPQGFLGYESVSAEAYYYGDNVKQHVVCEDPESNLCADRYTLADCITDGDDHCKTPLVAGGNIC